LSKIEVNTVEPQCGTTLTLGASGDTVALASGAKMSGVQAVSWQTGSIKTSGFTAAAGEGYFCNTSSSAFTVTLPSGSAGAVVAVSDYTRTFQTNNLTITPQSGEKIGGTAASATLSTEGQSATFVYVDSTEGWINVQETSNSVTGTPPFIQATGGTIVTCGNFKTHIFTGPGTFTVSSIAPGPSGNPNQMDYLVVAGGGAGGGASAGGGGGAGGFRMSNQHSLPAPTTSPLANPTGLTATATSFPITVGSGGAGASLGSAANPGTSGANSVFSTITSTGGGFGSGSNSGSTGTTAANGGSGGGGSHEGNTGSGNGNTPPVSPSQGNPGGTPVSPTARGAGGGGAGAAGATSPGPSTGGAGGVGSFIADGFVGPTAPSYGESGPVSSARYFAGGGGGSADATSGAGGAGGGGQGSNEPPSAASQAVSGTDNTGGGGGGARGNLPSAYIATAPNSTNGGSGIVMIRYKFQ